MSQYATWPANSGGGGGGLPITAVDNPLVYNSMTGHLSILDASATQDGTVSTGTQTFAGNKTFTGSVTVLGVINADGGIDRSSAGTLTIGATNSNIINIGNSGATVNIQGTTIYENTPQLLTADPLITVNHGGGAGSGQNAGIEVEEASVITGFAETSSDRNSWTFKAPNTAGSALITPGASGFTINQGSHDPVTLGTANGLSLSVQVLSLALSSTSTTGSLSSTDWNTFNSKQAAGNYISALSGDVTATGPGSVTATIPVGTVTDTKSSLAVKPAVTVVATTNQALTGTPTIDGVATAAGSVILLSAQSTGSQNGPWVAAAGAWSRPTWYPSGGTTQAFQFITTLVRLGTVYQGSTWRMTTAGAITIDTTATTWAVTPIALNASTVTGILPNANTTAASANTASAIVTRDASGNFAAGAITAGSLIVSGFTTGSVVFVDGSSTLAQDNSNFFWDATNHRLGVGITSPSFRLEVPWKAGDAVGTAHFGATTIGNNQIAIQAQSNSNHAILGSSTSGAGVFGQSFGGATAAGVAGTGGAGGAPAILGSASAGFSAIFQTSNVSGTNANATVVSKGNTSQTADLFQAQSTAAAVLMNVTSAGFIGVGVTTPQAGLDIATTGTAGSAIIVPRDTTGNRPTTLVNGMIRYNTTTTLFEFYQAGAWVNYTVVSDARLKTNISPVSDASSMIAQLQPVYFDWDKSTERGASFGDRRQVGLIAQDVEKIIPEAVSQGEDSFRTIQYEKILAVAIAAIQELQQEVSKLKAALAAK